MNDLISRQAAIDSIEKHLRFGDELYPLTDTDKVLNHGFEIAASCVYNLPSAQSDLSEYSDKLWKVAYERGKAEVQQRWIPCSERLPEKEEQVLIYAWNVHYVLAKYREIRTCDGVYKMAWVTEDAYSAPREIKHEVICWMPLPEPYKEGES